MHLSPECAAPLEAALLWPPTLLRPPMLRTLPAPVRDERIVLAFVATVSASATCRARPHFLNLLTPRHKVLRKPFSRAACSCTTGVAGLDSVLHSVLGGQTGMAYEGGEHDAYRFGAGALHATAEAANLPQIVKVAVIACSVIKAATWPPFGLRGCTNKAPLGPENVDRMTVASSTLPVCAQAITHSI